MPAAVSERLRERAIHAPAEAALVIYGAGKSSDTWTWARLDRVTAGIADVLSTAATSPGKCMSMAVVGNGPQDIVNLIGMLRLDLPLAVVSARAPELETASLCAALARRGYDIISIRETAAHVERSCFPVRDPLPSESLLVPTGGSTARPKVVIDPWLRSVGRRPRQVRPSSAMNWRPGQRQLIIGPLYHAAPLTFFVEGLSDGNTLLAPRAFDADEALEAVREWQVEWLHATPYHLRHLAIALDQAPTDLSSVRGLVHLAAACPAQLKRDWLSALRPDRVFEMYGATEGIGLTIARGDEWLRRPGTVGRGFFTHIRILDADGRRVPAGETGHIYMRSGPRARRFYLDAGDPISTTADGFASVGDRGWVDDQGYLYLAARQLKRVQVGGETVDPGEVESVLASHPAVIEAAVMGIPDERLGESLVAVVVVTDASHWDSKSMKRYLRERLARYKVPRVIRFVDQVPHTETGKIDRRRLAGQVASEDIADARRGEDSSRTQATTRRPNFHG
jgi:bile acid-coenzyme A ligase